MHVSTGEEELMLTLKEEKEKREKSGESGARSCGGSAKPA